MQVHRIDHFLCMRTQSQRAKQPVDLDQFRAHDFGQLTLGHAPHHFHLKQAVLGVYITQRAVQVRLVAGFDVRHPQLVITHGDWCAQAHQGEFT